MFTLFVSILELVNSVNKCMEQTTESSAIFQMRLFRRFKGNPYSDFSCFENSVDSCQLASGGAFVHSLYTNQKHHI